ncbi:hypothetical protein BGX23_010067 [Mortierella sp. AD031]|nr:hypothetical protein BGX23_010067 [Mortierella sp. AD031]
MVYATRSKALNKDTPTIHRVPISTKNISASLSKKTPSTIYKKNKTATNTNTTATTTTHTISTEDGHRKHVKDGKDHHIAEEDGQDRHHIWYRDFSENEDLAHHNHKAAQSNRSRSDRRESLHSEERGANASQHSRKRQHLSRHAVATALRLGTPVSYGVVPKTPVDHHHVRYISEDDTPSTAMEVDGHSRQLANLSTSGGGSSDEGEHHHRRHRHHRTSNSGPSRASYSAVTEHSSKSLPGKGTTHIETTKSNTPLHYVNSTVVDRAGQHAVTNHYKASESTTTTRTTTTTHANAEPLTDQHERLSRHEAASHRLAQKSMIDREKAHEAILSLDHDVILLQKLLQEKEDALRAAEARAAEFQQITIRDLRTNLHNKEKALKESQHQQTADRVRSHEQHKQLEHEITTLNNNLKAKEHAQQESLQLQKDLDEANRQRARLIVQVREITETLKEKETSLMGAHTTIMGLEHSNKVHHEETDRLSEGLGLLKKKLAGQEKELKDYHHKIKNRESAQEKIKNLRDQLSERDAIIKDLEKDNKALNHQGARADKLADEVRVLKDDLADRENQLAKALKSAKSLTMYKDKAIELELEAADLRDQVNVQEKHLTYLEDALMAHENCAIEAKELQDQIDMLENLLHQKKGEVTELQEANKGLQVKDNKIETLQKEMQTILHEMETKDRAALKVQEKAGDDLAKVSSTASALRTEVEKLRQELNDKTQEFKQAHKGLEELKAEKDRTMSLTVEITKLEKIIADKDRQVNDLEKIVESMKAHVDRADRLEGEVKELSKEVRHGKNAADQAAKDLAAASSTASTLRVEVESLREQLGQRAKELEHADKVVKDLEHKTRQVKELLTKINGLEQSQQHYSIRAHNAEEKSKGLEADITALETRLEGLRHQLKEKEDGFQAALEKANKDHDAAKAKLEESRALVADLKKQLKESEKDTLHQLQAKDDQTNVLQNEIQEWENHEEGWVIKTTDLTMELEKGTDLIRHKEKTLHDLKHKIVDHNAEISRLNDALNQARSELHEDRKRRASEIEDQVAEMTHHLYKDKAHLKKTISNLEYGIKRLEKKIRLDYNHEVLERQLAEQIQELTLWKQNSVEQTKEWETTVANLEREKEAQVAILTRYERRIHSLQTQVDNADAWRLRAIEQAEKLTAIIVRLERELLILKDTLAQHDTNDAELTERIHSLTVQIEMLEGSREDLNREARTKDVQIAELEERLRGEVSSYKARLADTRRELVAKDKKIEVLHARIAEFTRQMADLESRVGQDRDSLAAMESMLDKLRHTLTAQMDKYKSLDSKYQTTLQLQADQDKQLYKLEKTLDRVTTEDAEKFKKLESKNRHLEKELDRALQTVDDFQVEIHNVTREYHGAMAALEMAKGQMAKMVPKGQANHDACAARVHAGEKEVAKLSSKILDLKNQIDRMAKDQAVRDSARLLSESGYKDRIHRLTKTQQSLESQLHDAHRACDHEKTAHDQDLVRAEREREKQEEVIQGLKQSQMKMQKEFTTMETRMRREMGAAKDLTGLLAKLKTSIKRDSEAELQSLDELEKELKSHESVVEETMQITRSRMDSGAFLETHEGGSMMSASSSPSSGHHNIAAH